MKAIRQIGSQAFVLGLFVSIFAGMPCYVMVADNPVLPWWLRISVFCLLGGALVVLITLALEQKAYKSKIEEPSPADSESRVMLLNSDFIPNRENY